MILAVVADSWIPLRCITSTSGARCWLAAMHPFSAWPDTHPASPQWQMTAEPGPFRARRPSAWPTATGTIAPRRPELSSVPPATNDTCPAMSRLRRKASMTRDSGMKPSAERAE